VDETADISQEMVDQITDALARKLIDEALYHAVSERNAPIWPGKPTIPLHYATTPPIWPVAPHYDFGLRCPTCGAYPGHYMTCAARDGAPRMV
jgi:hypothetical protein